MRLQVEVGAVRDALQLAPLRALEAEPVLDVDGPLRVVRELLLRVLEVPQVVPGDAEAGVPVGPVVDPVLVPLLVGAGLDEELHLHLLELAGPEDEVARGDLVPERLADLADAERRLLPGRGLDVLVVDEDALRGLRPQVVQAGLVLDRAEVGLQQAAELLRLGPGALGAAVRAGHVGQRGGRAALALGVLLLEVVGPVPAVAGLALDQRVGERGDVAGGHPDLPGQDDGRVEADHVVPAGDHVPPPLPLDVLLELHTVRAVVPRRPGSAVDLAAGVHEPPALAEVDHGFEAGFGLRRHGRSLHPAGCRRVSDRAPRARARRVPG